MQLGGMMIGCSLGWLINPAQKMAQLDETGHLALHDIVCLWAWLAPKLQNEFPNNICDRHAELFAKGCLELA